MRPSHKLHLEQMEDRSLPAVFGTPWADGSSITLSFAPDGTDINGVASNLGPLLSALGDSTSWEILRAFQTWAVHANINIGLVADSGDDFDAAGLIQGDSRFGDIRIGGRAWADDVLALTTAFHYFDTSSGNVVLNTSAAFSLGGEDQTYDLFTVMLQEAGHALGVGNNSDTTSAMYEYYLDVRSGLSADDIAAIQALYGTRAADEYEGTTGNDTSGNATVYSGSLTADLTSSSDIDYFQFTVTTSGMMPVIRLQAAGLSLVESRIDVLNAAGEVIASGVATSPTDNNITLEVPGLDLGETAFVRVSSNRSDVFGVGAYRLTIDGAGLSSGSTGPVGVTGDHSTLESAAVLLPQTTEVNDQLDYVTMVTPDVGAAASFVRVQAPTAATGQTVHMVVSVNQVNTSEPVILRVYDASGQPMALQVLTQRSGAAVVRVADVVPGDDYYVEVVGDAAHDLTIDFTARDSQPTLGSTGSPTADSTLSAAMDVLQSQVLHFVLSAEGTDAAAIGMTILNENDEVVFELTATGGSSQSASIFLAAGTYRVEMRLLPGAGYQGEEMTYSLFGNSLTDPVGVTPVDPTGSGEGGGDPPTGGNPPPSGQTVTWTVITPGEGSFWF